MSADVSGSPLWTLATTPSARLFLQEVPRLLAELIELVACDCTASTRQFKFNDLANLVGEVAVKNVLLRVLDEMDEATEPFASVFEHRVGDVGPPLVGLNGGDQLQLLSYDRNCSAQVL